MSKKIDRLDGFAMGAGLLILYVTYQYNAGDSLFGLTTWGPVAAELACIFGIIYLVMRFAQLVSWLYQWLTT